MIDAGMPEMLQLSSPTKWTCSFNPAIRVHKSNKVSIIVTNSSHYCVLNCGYYPHLPQENNWNPPKNKAKFSHCTVNLYFIMSD